MTYTNDQKHIHSDLPMGSLENERVNLHSRLLDAVRACQTHLGGKNELVTETSIWWVEKNYLAYQFMFVSKFKNLCAALNKLGSWELSD